jgi:hypothetical protein
MRKFFTCCRVDRLTHRGRPALHRSVFSFMISIVSASGRSCLFLLIFLNSILSPLICPVVITACSVPVLRMLLSRYFNFTSKIEITTRWMTNLFQFRQARQVLRREMPGTAIVKVYLVRISVYCLIRTNDPDKI